MLYTVIYFLCPAGSTAGVETAGAAIVHCPSFIHINKYYSYMYYVIYFVRPAGFGARVAIAGADTIDYPCSTRALYV